MSLPIFFHLILSTVSSTCLFNISSGVDLFSSRFISTNPRSFSTSFIHARLGLPTFLCISVSVSSREHLTGVFSFKHIRCPSQLSLCIMVLYFSIFTFSYSGSFEMVFGHWMLITLRSSFLWNASMVFCRVSMRVHSSELYRKILAV